MTDQWLALKTAAERLGVHPTTLRRWADAGEIPVNLTPGGHRRFAVADLDDFAEAHRRLRMVGGLEQIWASHALSQARRELTTRPSEQWMASFNPEEREHKRQLGRRLMGIILQYIALHEGGEELLQEAQAVGYEHADDARAVGMPLVEAIRAALFFRDTLVEVAIQLPEVAHVRPEANTRLLRRINTVLNTVQLAIAERYESSAWASVITRPRLACANAYHCRPTAWRPPSPGLAEAHRPGRRELPNSSSCLPVTGWNCTRRCPAAPTPSGRSRHS
jgi:excisionase family DNA binding protein